MVDKYEMAESRFAVRALFGLLLVCNRGSNAQVIAVNTYNTSIYCAAVQIEKGMYDPGSH